MNAREIMTLTMVAPTSDAPSRETKLFDPLGLVRLAEDECWGFLERHRLGRVAFIHLDQPAIFPVNYCLDDRSVVFRTGQGSKLGAATGARQAAFEVDEAVESLESGTSVVVHGRLRRITDRDEVEQLRRLPLRPWAAGKRDDFVRLEPQYVTGRRIEPAGPPIT